MAKKRLGQHFLSDPSILKRIAAAAEPGPDDLVVEIGPGHGGLTRILAGTVKKVIAIELDETLCAKLRDAFASFDNVEIIQGDALEYPYEELPEFKVAANIPYYITTPIIFRLLKSRQNLRSMTLTIQKEVAERIVAKPGGKEYGVLSIMVQYYAEPAMKFIIPGKAFRPVPKVDSAVLQIKVRAEPPFRVRNEERMFKIVKAAFSQRRKMLSNSLRSFRQDVKAWLDKAGIDPARRPETLSLEEFARLADTWE
ncbi:MAG: 16S rRNA (adenine(1518)-N(6)/adenine(1519)-N(6))-dimethyltransferase RsmA [Nitrospirota bacterium]